MIVSVSLNTIPFLSSTDSTRASMSAKQIQQALTSLNCEVPYVIGSDYRTVTETSRMGIILAKDDGEVIYKNRDILIVKYNNLNKTQDIHIPPIKKTSSSFGTKLRNSLESGKKFQKGDILAEYDCFMNGVPSYGYNVFTAYMPWFGYNHEDALVISESLSKKTIMNSIDKVYIPIYEYTLMQEFYNDVENSYVYFPSVGQTIKNDIIACVISPRESATSNSTDLKNRVQMSLKNMSLSNLLNFRASENPKFLTDRIKSKLINGKITGIKIHRFKKPENIDMIDKKLQDTLEKIYLKYIAFISETLNDLGKYFHRQYIELLLKKYYIYRDKGKGTKGDISLTDICYLIELEISKEEHTHIGDKLANRYANKGIVSLILPDELRPIAIESNKPIDLIYNPFGVYSRMNHGQVLEGLISKSVMYCNEHIKNHSENTKVVIEWLNENVLKFIDQSYYDRINDEIIKKLDDPNFHNMFVEDIKQSNLFIEAPSFAEVDIKNLMKNSINCKETVLLKKDLIKYMKQKLKVDINFPEEDIYLKNIFCSPIYIQKLSKIVSKIINARDFGSVKSITRQPTKGRASGGGSRVGQMELEAMLAAGCDLAVKEILSVKSDWSAGKKDLLRQLVTDCQYKLPENRTIKSRTREVVDLQLQYLKE
ncbi:MAG TPA: hypothetical protein PKG96_09785, partial [Bacilli bacterium]|jgi:DNA-directed RNA polymerase subunit beta|nr:hypothetical protein [Bacilli bacterium]HQM07486.1 hypothetical protein [Bacilli bacterium]